MQLTNIKELNAFMDAVNQTTGDVWLESNQGDKFNLKSALSSYIALGALLGENGDQLELFCANREDEGLFLRFFKNYPNTI